MGRCWILYLYCSLADSVVVDSSAGFLLREISVFSKRGLDRGSRPLPCGIIERCPRFVLWKSFYSKGSTQVVCDPSLQPADPLFSSLDLVLSA